MVTLDYDKAAHLYRRAGFGASRSEIEALVGLDAGNPNENYARELMELFTLGIKDDAGVDNYSQSDVHQLARALTGYVIDHTRGVLDPGRHDDGADKTFMGVTGNLGVEGVPAADDVIEIIFSHQDTRAPAKPRVARF